MTTFVIDRSALICAVDWLAEGLPMDAVVAHLKDPHRDHKVKLPDEEIAVEVQRAWSTWPLVRDNYQRKA